MNRVYNHFYRHQLVYGNVTMNCAGISIDALRALGWNIDARAPVSRLVAWLGVPWFAIRDRSIARARQAFDYLSEDGTRMFPAAAFEETAADLLRLAAGQVARDLTSFERMLSGDIEALLWVRVPQLPSSRAWGDFAVVTGRVRGAAAPRSKQGSNHPRAAAPVSTGTSRPRLASASTQPQRMGGCPVGNRFPGWHTLASMAMVARTKNRRENLDLAYISIILE
jgi:hypothetical protein